MKQLTVIVRDQKAFMEAIDAQIEAFARLHPDVEIRRVSPGIEECYERFVVGEGAFTGEADLFLSVTDWIPQAAQRGAFRDLSAFLSGDPPVGFPAGWHRAMLEPVQVAGRYVAFPYHDGPQVLHYRADLFEDAAEQASFRSSFGRELGPPQTWSEFLEVAKFFTRPGLWGCCFAAYPDGHNDVYDFLVHLWSRGGELLDASNRPVFASETGVQALSYYAGLLHEHRVADPACLELNSVASGVYYAQGHAAMMWNWCGLGAPAEDLAVSKIVGQNRTTLMPRGDGAGGSRASLNVFWAMAILSGSPEPALAYEFLKFLTTPEMDLVTTQHGANGVRLSTWNNKSVQAKIPYYALIQQVHEESRSLPAIPEYPLINKAISDAVHDVMAHGANPRQALTKAQAKCTEILGT